MRQGVSSGSDVQVGSSSQTLDDDDKEEEEEDVLDQNEEEGQREEEKEFPRLTYTGLVVELEHLKIETV
jgi:hypothetical protein